MKKHINELALFISPMPLVNSMGPTLALLDKRLYACMGA